MKKGSKDSQIATLSKKENRVLVTNDNDFIYYPKEKIHAVILLKVAQNKIESLIESFQKLLFENQKYKSQLIILKEKSWQKRDLSSTNSIP